jgi:general L-amino acid transport system permease protein
MAETAFVRREMLPPREAPASERGLIHWARTNLFSSWLNAILTLLALLAIWQFLTLAVPWQLHAVWTADSLGQCREIIAANWGPDATGACWAVIHERWHQFVFGFYPQDLWWRPIGIFGLMFVALVPVLFSSDPRTSTRILVPVAVLTVLALALTGSPAWMLAAAVAIFAGLIWLGRKSPLRLLPLTLIYPFLAVWALWGGSVWGVVTALFGFAVLTLVYRLARNPLGVVVGTGVAVVAAALWWLFLDTIVADALSRWIPIAITPVESDKFGGFLLAFVIGVSSISVSLPIGILLALGRQSNMPLIHLLSVGFIEFVRGVPLITMLFTASLLLQYFLPPQVQFDLILRVVILVTLFSAAYNAEVIRGGLAGLPKGQYEAADALGLDYWQAQRLVIMPQALKISIPGIVNNFIGLFKDTTLVSFVGLLDPLRGVTNIVRADINWKGIYWEPYIFVGAIFFAACYGMSRYALYLERKLKTDHR